MLSKPDDELAPLKIIDTIALFENSAQCNELCQPIIEYTKRYALPSEDSTILAVLPTKKCGTADNFFNDAFGKNTRYQFRKVVEDGYTFHPISKAERNARLAELYAINTSARERQGGAMNESYFSFPEPLEQETCPHHFIKTYGAFSKSNEWVGYIDMVFGGEWANAKHFLGHKLPHWCFDGSSYHFS